MSTEEVIMITQTNLGKYVKKPNLSEKLLSKPPFRFIHDIVMVVIKDTNYLKDLFTESELNSTMMTNREAKTEFLNKLIAAVKATTKLDLKVQTSKIIAGLEPMETNKLLQAVAYAIDNKISSKDYVKTLNAKSKKDKSKSESRIKQKPDTKEKSRESKKNIKNVETKSNTSKRSSTDRKSNEKKLNSTRSTTNLIEKSETVIQDEQTNVVNSDNTTTTQQIKEAKINEENYNLEKDEQKLFIENRDLADVDIKEVIKIERPKTGRKKIPDVALIVPETISNDIQVAEIIPQIVESNKNIINLPPAEIIPIEPEVEISQPPKISTPIPRLQSAMRMTSARLSSARPGAPRLRLDSAIPQNITTASTKVNIIMEPNDSYTVNDEEVVQIEDVVENLEMNGMYIKLETIAASESHLVQQILEQAVTEDGSLDLVTNDKQRESNNFIHHEDKSLSTLNSSIQSVTLSTNTLGKLMGYLHEDVDAMHSELAMWINSTETTLIHVERKRRELDEITGPLRKQLQELEEHIDTQKQEIAGLQYSVYIDGIRIRSLIEKIISGEKSL